jgi:hypothetical protein
VDVTAAAGLAEPHPTLGCSVADFDNDGYPDLLLTGAGSQRLFRNNRKGGFEDVTAKAGLDKLTAVCLGSAFVDLDQDGDLDLLIAEYARTPADALKLLKGEKGAAGAGLAVYLNVGLAQPRPASQNQPPLNCAWKRAELKALGGPAIPLTGVAVSDLDGDRDPDVLLLGERGRAAVALNDRLLSFRRQVLPKERTPPVPWNGGLVLDADHDGRSDLLLLAAGERPRLLLNRSRTTEKNVGAWFEPGATNSPPLLQAVAVDVDLDGWTDVVGLSHERRPVLLHNEGGRLVLYRDALGRRAVDWPKDLLAVAVLCSRGTEADEPEPTHCGGVPDLLVWSESQGLQLYANRGNAHHGVQLRLTGKIKEEPSGGTVRSNADGIGAWVAVQAANLWAGQENTTLSAGLGQSRQPLLLGLGQHNRADVVRIWWPDGTTQAELDWPCGPRPPLVESNRKKSSCPILFAWDGRRFGFITDFLGAGSVGERGPDGTCRPPRPEESVKIEPHQLAPRGGAYVLKMAEPMDEITYLDQVQLVAIDHPAGVSVYPDERFATDGLPSGELIAFKKRIFPVRAIDHRGRDVTAALRAWDRATVDGFARRSWPGFAEEHAVELDFGDRLAGLKGDERLFLCLAGWTDDATPESIWAAHQAGVVMKPPVLERLGTDGRWHQVCEAGFPAGLPRMMLREVTGKLSGPRCRLRLRTNLQVFWDQAFVAVGQTGKSDVRATCLEVARATLEPCGLMQEFSPDGRAPTLYAFDRYESVPVVRPAGRLTRFGDVTELLRGADDRFVIFGPGDLLTLRFDARRLPPLPTGWQRSFVVRSRGYCKDTAPFTATGATVEPLPFQAMRNYPPGPGEHYPRTKLHLDYLRRYNTREVTPPTRR